MHILLNPMSNPGYFENYLYIFRDTAKFHEPPPLKRRVIMTAAKLFNGLNKRFAANALISQFLHSTNPIWPTFQGAA